MNYYTKGGQAYGLKSLAQELPKYGRYGDDVVAHISSNEARMLQAMGGSGTINPSTGLPEFFKIRNPFKPITKAIGQLNPLNPGSSLSKTINTTPVVGDINKALNKVGTQIFQPVEKAIVQPVSAGLASFDKAVGNAIPGGWGTVGSIALSAMGAPVPLQVAYGAARGSGVMRKGGNFNLQGAMIGGATAYAQAKLGEYMRGAAPGSEVTPTVDSYGNLVNPAPVVDYSQALTPPSAGDFAGSLSDPTAGMAEAFTPAPSFLDKVGTRIGDAVGSTAKFTTGIPTTGVSTAAQTGQGALNLLGLGEGTASAAAANAATTGIKALPMAGMALFGETSLSALDDQRKYLEEAKRTNAINQAEYDSALGEINRQRDYADKIVRENPINPYPNRDVSIGDTLYGRTDADRNLYARELDPRSTLYAMGGSVDDEYGMDESRNLGLGNLQKGLFGMGYAAGGQVKGYAAGGMFGGGYNPLANLPPMSGALGAVRQDMTTFDPNFNKPNFDAIRNSMSGINTTTQQDILGGNRNQVSGGLSNIFNQSAPQISPSVNQNPNTNMGGFASPSSFYGGGGGGGGFGGDSGGAFPLEGKYGIVKMAAGGMPRFLSGGGDGMSDDIKATINGNQPARLADGEFVIPADVVSHLGNGSSKAGAKQLYSMMDKVRKARTGNPKQGKQINPRKYIPA
jgi:hypothetical protein